MATPKEYRFELVKTAMENHLSVNETKEFIKLFNEADKQLVYECRIGQFAELTGFYKTVAQRCNEMGIETVGDLVRYGGRAFRDSPDVGAKTAAIISDTLQEKFGIDNWFSKGKEEV